MLAGCVSHTWNFRLPQRKKHATKRLGKLRPVKVPVARKETLWKHNHVNWCCLYSCGVLTGAQSKCSVGSSVDCDCTTVRFLKRVLQMCCLTPLWWVSKWWEKGWQTSDQYDLHVLFICHKIYEWGSKYHGAKAILISLLTYPGPWHKHLEWSPNVYIVICTNTLQNSSSATPKWKRQSMLCMVL